MSKILKFKVANIKFWVKYFGFFIKMWYRFTMFLSKTKGYEVKKAIKVEEIAERLEFGDLWKKDPRLDFMYHPKKVQKWTETKHYEHFDCEDHSSYACAVILKSNLAKKVWVVFYYMIAKDNTVGGHALYVFEDYDGKLYWADYNYPKEMNNIWDWVTENAKGYGAIPICATMIEIRGLKGNDTLLFGKKTYKEFLD